MYLWILCIVLWCRGEVAAKDRGKTTSMGGTDGGQVVDQREGRRAGGLAAGWGVGNPALRESALGIGGL